MGSGASSTGTGAHKAKRGFWRLDVKFQTRGKGKQLNDNKGALPAFANIFRFTWKFGVLGRSKAERVLVRHVKAKNNKKIVV